ncbi:MAG: hypothetical protein NUV73_04150, partial [Candidatus Daviesbacteria bacterium]|nr:hypothetical protein [Candidatus Daviesbacteria bacterium]
MALSNKQLEQFRTQIVSSGSIGTASNDPRVVGINQVNQALKGGTKTLSKPSAPKPSTNTVITPPKDQSFLSNLPDPFEFLSPLVKKSSNFIDQMFKLPDKAITKGQSFLEKPENQKITKPLAWVQERVIEPIILKNPLLRGWEKGVVQTYLGSSKKVMETFNQPIDIKQSEEGGDKVSKGAYTVGEVIGQIHGFIAGGAVLKGIGLAKATMPILFG